MNKKEMKSTSIEDTILYSYVKDNNDNDDDDLITGDFYIETNKVSVYQLRKFLRDLDGWYDDYTLHIKTD